jgi:hypothetical protein
VSEPLYEPVTIRGCHLCGMLTPPGERARYCDQCGAELHVGEVSVISESARLRYHEAAHQVAAVALGCQSRGVTTIAGEHAAGCGRFILRALPAAVPAGADAKSFITWPAPIRADVETRCVIALAGPRGEALIRDEAPCLPPVAMAEAVVLAASLPEADPSDAGHLAAETNTVKRDDAADAAYLAAVAHPGEPGLQSVWLEYMEAVTDSLIRAEALNIRKLVALLEYRPVLDGAAVAACIRDSQP